MKSGNAKGDSTEIVVVLPCYNEARRLDAEAIEHFLHVSPGVTLLFVDDGSTDDTPLLMERVRQRVPEQVCTLRLSSNRGKAEAVRSGIANALRRRPAFVGFWDADLSTPLELIPRLAEVLRARPSVQLAMGSRVAMLGRKVQRNLWRHLLGRAFATAASIVLRLPVYDTQCGAKLIRVTPSTAELFSRPFRARWIFDVELLARIVNCSELRSASPMPEDLLYEHPVERWHEVHGSRVRVVDFFVAIRDLWAIYWRDIRPMHSPGPLAQTASNNLGVDDRRRAAA